MISWIHTRSDLPACTRRVPARQGQVLCRRFLVREGAPPHPVDDEQNEYEQRADVVLAASVQTLGGQNIWAGAIPSGLHGRLVARGGLSDAQATKLLAELAKKARDASAGVWRARCKWVNELSTNAETRNRWRTAVRRVAQNNLMAVGSLGAARKMTNPQFAAWRRKIIRWIAGAQWRKGTSDMWESHMVSLTETELSSMPVQPRTPHAGSNAQDYKTSKRQRLTQAQQASDLAERAQAAGRRAEKGWAAPGLADTPLGLWYAGEWKAWAKEMDELSSAAERIAVGARVTEEGRTKTMGRLKAKTHATEKLVGVQRSALARRVGVEALWARWLAGNGWADEVELQRTSGVTWDKLGGGRWASRLRGADYIGENIELLDKAKSTLLRESKSWAGGEPLGGWWQDREEAFCGKVDALRIRLAEALYEEPGKAGKICKETQALLTCMSRLHNLHSRRSMLLPRRSKTVAPVRWAEYFAEWAQAWEPEWRRPRPPQLPRAPLNPPSPPLSPHSINYGRLWRTRCGGDER